MAPVEDLVELSRWQFALTAMYHFIFAPLAQFGGHVLSVVPSSAHPDHGLTVFDAVSSHCTLAPMSGVVVIFLPLVRVYTGWRYR
jgi:cytochrome bd-type quinol oxidase subunit 2